MGKSGELLFFWCSSLLPGIIYTAAHHCLLKGSNAHCKVEIADRLHGDVYVNVDTCSKPVDVTISIQIIGNASSWSWHHSFVNVDERQPMKGLRSDIFLHVSIKAVETTKLRVSAKFVSQHKQSVFLDDYVDSREYPCHMKDNPNGLLPLVLFVVLISLVAAGLVMLVCFRRQRNQWRTRRHLLPNMEVPVINPISDSQMPPITSFTDQADSSQILVESSPQSSDSAVGHSRSDKTFSRGNDLARQISRTSSQHKN